VLTIKDDLKDYVDRGAALAGCNFLDFFLNTYEGEILAPPATNRGRKPNERVPYLENTGHGTKCRVIRTTGHETMPMFVGEWFPRNDVEEERELYCASMLALLQPWHNIGELKSAVEKFEESFSGFMKKADDHTMDIIQNIQYQHECSDSAAKKRSADREDNAIVELSRNEAAVNSTEYEGGYDESSEPVQFTQNDIERELASEFSLEDQLYAETALNIAMDKKIFDEENARRSSWEILAAPATHEQIINFQIVEKMIKKITKNRTTTDNRQDISLTSVDSTAEWSEEPGVSTIQTLSDEPPEVNLLNNEQRRAHDIVVNHLKSHLAGGQPPQQLVLINGAGGTGKSTLLNAIASSFARLDASHLLKTTALSGVAASLIGGSTLHWFAGLPPMLTPQSDIWPDNSSKYIKDRRIQNLLPILWLFIDEISMCTVDLFTLLSQVCGKVRAGDATAAATIPFGGLNITILGDFHQFPPVGRKSSALYSNCFSRNTAVVGKSIYSQFETVINLHRQERVKDNVWLDILQRIRSGECTPTDLNEIRKLVLTNPECQVPDFTKPPWDDALLVTPRNSVRSAWNRAMLRKHCNRSGNLLYIVEAEDSVGDSRVLLNMEQRLLVASMSPEDSRPGQNTTKKLRHRLEIAKGMKIMVTLNLATEADLANGSRGIVEDIVLDPRERVSSEEIGDDGTVWLQYPPAMILFRPFHYEFEQFPGFEPGLIPIFPSEVTFNIHYKNNPKTQIHRRQFPLCAAYAFTDHKSQGQTIEYVIVDIGPTKKFPVDPFAAYVALSRSRGRHSIRLLRDFDDRIFTKHPSEDLRAEDERLSILAEETRIRFEGNYYNYNVIV
jgi:hypothetical protein